MSRRALWLTLVGVVLLALGGTWLSRYVHTYQEVIDEGPSAQARQNPYLAAQRFLSQQGLPAEHANGLEVLPNLPAKGHSLMLLGERSQMSPRQVEQVLAWVRAGGRLLFVAEALWDDARSQSGDLLLDRLQLRQQLSAQLQQLPPAEGDEHPELTKLYLENEGAPAYFSFDPQFHLEDPTNKIQSWANSSGATHLMQLAYGQGLVTVVTDADLWTNRQIVRYDNAWLLWYLSQGTSVTLLFDTAHDNLLALLWRYFAQALAALGLLLLFGAWHLAQRQGPVQWPAPAGRRQLLEHLRASADFRLRQHGQSDLLATLQHDILRRARRRHPGFEKLAVAEQWQVLARLSRQPTRAISQALLPLGKKRLSASEFSRQVAHLQTLRNAL